MCTQQREVRAWSEEDTWNNSQTEVQMYTTMLMVVGGGRKRMTWSEVCHKLSMTDFCQWCGVCHQLSVTGFLSSLHQQEWIWWLVDEKPIRITWNLWLSFHPWSYSKSTWPFSSLGHLLVPMNSQHRFWRFHKTKSEWRIAPTTTSKEVMDPNHLSLMLGEPKLGETKYHSGSHLQHCFSLKWDSEWWNPEMVDHELMHS